jgi:hypothetical protein
VHDGNTPSPSAGDPPAFPTLEEIEHLHRSLSIGEREELLECLLIAAPSGGDSMMGVLQSWIVAVAAQELIDGLEK